jgi:Family of unknown function (DUF6011)
MRCGNHSKGDHEHETVAEVRACFGVVGESPEHAEFFSEPATEKQEAFLKRLEEERGLTPHAMPLTKREAGELIQGLLEMPKPEQNGKPDSSWEDIPKGHYATDRLTGNNDLDFWRVDKPTEGRWAGFVFVKRVIGGKPDAPVKGTTRFKALSTIREADPEKAAIRYGQEIGRCWRCNRHLTDETSRALGIGPDCRSRIA